MSHDANPLIGALLLGVTWLEVAILFWAEVSAWLVARSRKAAWEALMPLPSDRFNRELLDVRVFFFKS